jgi:hypothetical protein
VGLSANRPLLDLFLYEDTGADSQFRFVVIGNRVKVEGVMQKLAAGHYQATLPLSTPGDYRIEITEDRRGRHVAYPPIGYSLPYELDNELPRPDFNLPLLSALAQSSGGEINPRFVEASEKQQVTNTFRPLHQPLIIWAGVLFLLEIVARKLFFPEA